MARKRASMREGPLAELFRATEAAQRQAERQSTEERPDPVSAPEPAPFAAEPDPEPEVELPPAAVAPPAPAPTAPAIEEYSPPARRPDPAPEPPAEERETRWVEPLPEQPPRLWAAPRADSPAYLAVIRVVAVNTDIQQLQMSDAPVKIHIGRELTAGLGSGADPGVGRQAADEAYDQIKRALRGSDMVFVAAGEGGGTGSGAAPVIARIARELGSLAVGIVTMPFRFEGTRRKAAAEEGVQALRAACDTVIVVPNDRLLEVLEKNTSMLDAFKIADDVLRQGVQGICDLITMPGLINLDFADVRTVMQDGGNALMGIG